MFGEADKIFLMLWEKELAAAYLKLAELTIIKFEQKPFDLETEFISILSLCTVHKDWLLKTRNHL